MTRLVQNLVECEKPVRGELESKSDDNNNKSGMHYYSNKAATVDMHQNRLSVSQRWLMDA